MKYDRLPKLNQTKNREKMYKVDCPHLPEEEHPFLPFVPEYATKLIIGTIPPERFYKKNLFCSDVNFYYGSKDNAFWNLLGEIFGIKFLNKNNENEIQKRKSFLTDKKIGICDIVKKTTRKNGSALDKDLDVKEFLDITELLEANPNIDTLIYTSGTRGVKSMMSKYLKNKYNKEICHTTINKESKEYKLVINDKVYKIVILYSPSPTALRSLGENGKDKRLNQWKQVFN